MITHAPTSALPTASTRLDPTPPAHTTRRLTGATLLALLPYLEAVLLLIACGYGL